ncbi:MAG: sucrase ferredoxin [Pseudanabaena sp.]
MEVAPLVNERNSSKQTKSVIAFKKKKGFSKGYSRWKIEVESLEEVAPLIEDYLRNVDLADDYSDTGVRDILVCTHGSHDKCCAKYGIPFYREALSVARDSHLADIHVWQSSHFGGHRFAPTAIDFPEGRYYGGLDQNTFSSILMRTGDINCIREVYRGWGILSIYAQVLERELLLSHGWEWFNFNVESQIISQNEDKTFSRVEIMYESHGNILHSCVADIVKDENSTLYLKGSCNGKESERVKFRAENIVFSDGL